MAHETHKDAGWSTLAEDISGVGFWRIESATGDTKWSPNMFRLFGFLPGDEPPVEEAMNRLHPDDRVRAYSDLSRDLQGKTETSYSRIILPNGAIRVIEGRTSVEFNATGEVVAVIGAVMDVTHLVAHDQLPLGRMGLPGSRVAPVMSAELSHELRTPLTTIVGYAYLLATNPALPPALKTDAGRMHSASRALLAVANNMLGDARAEAVLNAGDVADVTVPDLVRECLDLFQPQAKQKGVSLCYWERADVPTRIRCQADALRQILINLVGNAVKFTGQGSVTVHASYDGAHRKLLLTVEDTGPGFGATAQQTLFGRFARGNSADRLLPSGAGLGLSIVKGLVDALKGEIRVHSAPGCGSRFSVALPCLSCEPSDLQPQATRARILVVDDNASIREIAARILEAAGANVATASNGFEALEIARRESFDVILLDINMPDVRGDRVAMELRTTKLHAPPLLVAMTAAEPNSRLMKFFDDWIRKPFDPKDFVRLIMTSQLSRVA